MKLAALQVLLCRSWQPEVLIIFFSKKKAWRPKQGGFFSKKLTLGGKLSKIGVMSANAGVITANGDFVPINNKKRKQVAEENFLKRQAEEQAKKQQEAQAKALADDAARARAEAEAARLAQVCVHPSRDW